MGTPTIDQTPLIPLRMLNEYVYCSRLSCLEWVQAARSGKQNIAEGSMASGTSKKTELKPVGVARASLKELPLDFKDFLRQKGFRLWGKDHPQAKQVRAFCYQGNRSYANYRPYVETGPAKVAASAIICVIH